MDYQSCGGRQEGCLKLVERDDGSDKGGRVDLSGRSCLNLTLLPWSVRQRFLMSFFSVRGIYA